MWLRQRLTLPLTSEAETLFYFYSTRPPWPGSFMRCDWEGMTVSQRNRDPYAGLRLWRLMSDCDEQEDAEQARRRDEDLAEEAEEAAEREQAEPDDDDSEYRDRRGDL